MKKMFIPALTIAGATAFGFSSLANIDTAQAADSAFSCNWNNSTTQYNCKIAESTTTQVTTQTLKAPKGTGLVVNTGTSNMIDPNTGEVSGTISVVDAGVDPSDSSVEDYTVSNSFSDAYFASHPDNLKISDTLNGIVNTNSNPGPWTLVFDGNPSTLQAPAGAYCDSACQAQTTSYGVWKRTWQSDSGHIGSVLNLGADKIPALMGKSVTISDKVDSKVSHDVNGDALCTGVLKYNSPNSQQYGTVAQQTPVAQATVNKNVVSVSYDVPSSLPWGVSYSLNVDCAISPSSKSETYTDNGVINGTDVSASVTVASNSGNGSGDSKPTKPAVYTFTKTVQVDRYVTLVPGSKKYTAINKNLIDGLTKDSVLKYREDEGNCKVVATCMWNRTSHIIENVSIVKNVNVQPTAQDWMNAINKATPAKFGKLTTTKPVVSAKDVQTIAYALGKGATEQSPWGEHHNINQTFIAAS